MASWLYQLDSTNWSPERYRLEIWEGERWAWPVGRKTVKGQDTPKPGDVVVFFHAPSVFPSNRLVQAGSFSAAAARSTRCEPTTATTNNAARILAIIDQVLIVNPISAPAPPYSPRHFPARKPTPRRSSPSRIQNRKSKIPRLLVGASSQVK